MLRKANKLMGKILFIIRDKIKRDFWIKIKAN